MSDERIPMSREGYDKRKAELDRMQGHDMIEVTKRVATARELGDLSENAEYHAAREDQGMLQAKINMLKDQLSRSYLIEAGSLPTGTVTFGTRVTVRDLDDDEEESYELVGSGQDDPMKNRILTSSPLALGLLGKRKGETAQIQVPRGVIRLKILDISVADI